MLGRYFKFASNGSDKNVGNHYVEIEIYDFEGTNLALNKGLYKYSDHATDYGGEPSVVTDGKYDQYFDVNQNEQWVIIDLGAIYNIDYLKIWRYYSDGRIYNDCVISVSLDDITYTTVFDSAIDGTYAETSAGYTLTLPEVTMKYLVRSNSTLYTLQDNALVALETTELNAQTFQSYGFDILPTGTFQLDIIDPELLYWQDSDIPLPTLYCNVVGTSPVPQIVITESYDMSDSTILGINTVTANVSEDVLMAISFDDGITWNSYDGSQWNILEEENSGMLKTTIEAITSDIWSEIITSTSYKMRFVLPNTTSYVTSVVVDYLN